MSRLISVGGHQSKQYVLVIILGIVKSLIDVVAIGIAISLVSNALITDNQHTFGHKFADRFGVDAEMSVPIALVIAISLVFAHSVANVLFEALSSRIQLQSYQEIRERVFKGWMTADFKRTWMVPTGELTHILEVVAWEAAEALRATCRLIIASSIISVYGITLLWLSPVLCSIVFFVFVISFAAQIGFRKRLTRNADIALEQKSALADCYNSFLAGIRAVKVFQYENSAVVSAYKLSLGVRRSFARMVSLELSARLISSVALITSLLAVVALAFILEQQPLMLATFLLFLFRVQPQLGAASGALAELSRLYPSVEKIDSNLKTPPAVRSGRQITKIPSEIVFDHITFAYSDGEPLVLNGADFSLQTGSMNALAGPSGAGKSTIIKLLLRQVRPCSGVVRLGSIPIETYDTQSWFQHLSMAGQGIDIITGSIRENLRFGDVGATEEQMWSALEIVCFAADVRLLDRKLDTHVGKTGSRFSGGQIQRVCLARAILANPSILILDEATSAIDAETEMIIMQNIRRAYPKLTLLVVSHRQSLIEYADRVMSISDGMVVIDRDFTSEIEHIGGSHLSSS